MKAPLVALMLLSLFVGCSQGPDPVSYLIGVSQANMTEPWRVSMTQEIRLQASIHPDTRVIVADASDSLGKQILDVETFEGLGVDLLIISPLESEALTPTVSKAYERIPVIVLNRSVLNDQYTMFIGPDNARIGQEAGRFVADRLKDHGGTVLEILGRSGSPPTLERAQAFRDEIQSNPQIHLESPILANWLQDGAEDLVADRLAKSPLPNVIFAHNDAMAYGAWLAAQKSTGLKHTLFVGVDGLPGPRGGQAMLRSGVLAATFVSPTGGKEAVEYALDILHHQNHLPKQVILGTKILTKAMLDHHDSLESHRPPYRLGVLWSRETNHWHHEMTNSIRQAIRRENWTLVDLNGQDLPANLDAVILDVFHPNPTEAQALSRLESQATVQEIPLFRVGSQPPLEEDPSWTSAIGPDPREEGQLAARWFANRHRLHVLVLERSTNLAVDEVRLQALRSALAEHVPTVSVASLVCLDSAKAVKETMDQFLLEGHPCDAILAPAGTMAEAVTKALERSKIRHLVDVAAVGLDSVARNLLRSRRIEAVVGSPPDLGPLLTTEVARALSDPGAPRRLVTTYDMVSPP